MKKQLFGLAIAFFVLTGCDKESEILYPDPLFPAQEIFRAPLFIEVMTAEGFRVSNAKINLGATEAYTDASGLCYLTDAMVAKSSYLTVEKDGYFHASRRFYPSEGKAHFLKIVLLSNSRIAFFSTKDGAVLPLEDHATIRFPAEGYILGDGKAYDGIVVVSAKAIAADDPDLSLKMPGDLVGINVDSKFGALGSLGMIAVEMNTPDGDKLRFADGAEATIEMQIPQSMAYKAPASIPLWYFDEVEGIWKEEGMATKSGDRYIGNVNHFSFWNCDAWFETISWGASFTYEDGSPASQVKVCITIESLEAKSCATTNAEGIVSGMVAANELLLIEVRSECGKSIYAEEIGPFSDATMLGPLSISDPGVLVANVFGEVSSCEGDPIRDGFAIISVGDHTHYASLDKATGAFNVSITTCDEGDIAILAVDVSKNKLSIQKNFEYAPWIDADTIIVCEDNEELIDIEIVGFPNHYYFFFPRHGVDGGNIIHASDSTQQGSYMSLRFFGYQAGVYDNKFSEVHVHLPGVGWSYVDEKIIINVTEYPKIGECIKGTFSGTCRKEDPGSPGKEYPLVGTFSVVREE